jgi:hypothetical protein
MAESKASWLRESCPPWCVATHREEDFPDDREHQGPVREVPAVLLSRTYPEPGRLVETAEATTLDVVRHCRAGSREEWVYIGDDEHRLDVSLETARRIASALAETVASES